GILWLTPLKWYMGFSGVLTGLLVAAATLQWRSMPLVNGVILAAIGIKVFMEQLSGKAVIISTISQVPTAVDAHLYGAVCGLVLGTLGIVLRR
ncbi:MAG: rhomboid family intramembrane serine protease, partial [Porticoccaceae bacterium]|nr:rhomboid family intramembrane serine protease [Porticoccaceae bacterium]